MLTGLVLLSAARQAVPAGEAAAASLPAYGWRQLGGAPPGDVGGGGFVQIRMAEDAAHHQVVLWGSDPGREYAAATWLWDEVTQRWSALRVPTPVPSGSLAMAWDGHQVMVLANTDPNNLCSAQTWTWDGTAWRQVTTDGPSPAPSRGQDAAMAYDVGHDTVVLYGGLRCDPNNPNLSVPDTTTWIWDGKVRHWTPSAPPTHPTALYLAAMAWDGTELVMYGGEVPAPLGATGSLSPTTWTWDGSSWHRFDVTGPDPRIYVGMAHDPWLDRAILFGGTQDIPGGASSFTDVTPSPPVTWAFDGNTHLWTSLATPTFPSARVGPALATDSTGGGVVLYGGTAGQEQNYRSFDDTWVSAPPALPSVTTLTSSPNPSTVRDPVQLTATVSSPLSSGEPTGAVTMIADGVSTLGSGFLRGGRATVVAAPLTAGIHSIVANYSGDRHFRPSASAPLQQDVTRDHSIRGTAPSISGLNPPCGSTSRPTPVQVSGSGFDGATSVLFGHTVVSQLTIDASATVITVTAPAPAFGAVPVYVRTSVPGGAGAIFTYADACAGTAGTDQGRLASQPAHPRPSIENAETRGASIGRLTAGTLTPPGNTLTPGTPGGATSHAPISVTVMQPGASGSPGMAARRLEETPPEAARETLHTMVRIGDTNAQLSATVSIAAGALGAVGALRARRRQEICLRPRPRRAC